MQTLSLKTHYFFFFFLLIATGASAKDKVPQQKRDWVQNLPVEFIPNVGQILTMESKPATTVLFQASAPGMDVYVTRSGLSYVMQQEAGESWTEKLFGKKKDEEERMQYERIDLQLVGAHISEANVIKEEASEARFHFVLKGKSIYDVQKYKRLRFTNIYPGIDWVIYNSSEKGLKYDFVVRPGANPDAIRLLYRGAQDLQSDQYGNIVISGKLGKLKENAPRSFQLEQNIDSKFHLLETKRVKGISETLIKFDIAQYDLSKPLTIDPQLLWATYFGGSSYEGTFETETDQNGNVFLTGYCDSPNFPLLNMGGYYYPTMSESFLLKFNNSGTLLWSTFLEFEWTNNLAVSINGDVYICGYTSNNTAFTSVVNGGYTQAASGNSDAFIVRFNTSGIITWASLLGGNDDEYDTNIDCDALGNVFISGQTRSTNFPVMNAGTYFQASLSNTYDCFITKFNNANNMVWSTYFKGIYSVVLHVDRKNRLYVAGGADSLAQLQNAGGTSFNQTTIAGSDDIYLGRFSNTGSLQWGTYYGGANYEIAYGLGSDKNGNLYVSGVTNSYNFPVLSSGSAYFQNTLAGSYNDAFVLKFDSTCTRKWATYLGGTGSEQITEFDNVAVDTCNNVYVGLTTTSRNIPFIMGCDGGMQDNSIDTSVSNTDVNVYLARFSSSGTLMWSSLFGGDGGSFRTAIDADRFGNVFFSGEWYGTVNPATYPLQWPGGTTYTASYGGSDDLYIAKFSNNLIPQTFSYPLLCQSDSTRLPVGGPGFASGGTFSASPGLSINLQTGQITPSLSSPGTYTITYKVAPCYCPGAIANIVGTTTVSILSAPSLTVSGATSICTNEKRTYTVSGGSTYTWSTGPQTNTVLVSPGTSTSAIAYTVSSKASNGCVAKKILNITVSKCTGIDEQSLVETNDFKVFPNPSSTGVSVFSKTGGKIKLVNILGENIFEFEQAAGTTLQLDVSSYPRGSYFLENTTTKSTIKLILSE